MDLEELKESLNDLLGDGFVVDEDDRGQVVIYTGLVADADGELVETDLNHGADEDDDYEEEEEDLEDLEELPEMDEE